MNDIREFECDIRNVEGDLFECDSIVSEVGGGPTGNSISGVYGPSAPVGADREPGDRRRFVGAG